jgi:phospholipid-binding lipoprotein MlaA
MLLAAAPLAAAGAAHAGGLQPSEHDATAIEVPGAAPAAGTPAAEAVGDFSKADPWEAQNRKFFNWNEKLDARVVRPTALGYQRHTPGPLRRALRNFLSNLSEPVVFANDVLQLHPKRGAATAFRFACNSTIGIAGLFDVAAKAGVEHHSNGFGTTLGVYGVPAGPYVYLPVLGPSTVRDLTGDVVDGFADPFTWARYENRIAITASKTIAGGLDTRASADTDLQALNDTATDPYATLRSAYLQHRQAEIEGDLGGKDRALPDFDDSPVAPPATGTTPGAQPKGDPPKDPPADPQAGAGTPVAPTLPPAISGAWAGNPALGNSGHYDTTIQQERAAE